MKRATHCELWLDNSRTRYFLVPETADLEPGSFPTYNLSGECIGRDEACLRPFELSEAAAMDAATADLSATIDEIKQRLDTNLNKLHASIVPGASTTTGGATVHWARASSAILHLCKALPCVVFGSLSGESRRIDAATTEMHEMHRQFTDAGVHLESALTNFPARLAELRQAFDRDRRPK